MAPGKRIHKCGLCKINIGNNQDSIFCDICSTWIHADCAGLSREEITKMDELTCSSYFCETCKKNIPSVKNNNLIKDEITNLTSKFDAKFDDLNAKFDIIQV